MIIEGYGILWDPKKDAPAAEFVDGKLDTTDPRIIELAEMAGFVAQKEELSEKEGLSEKEQLIKAAEELGIEIDKRWGVKRLQEAVFESWD